LIRNAMTTPRRAADREVRVTIMKAVKISHISLFVVGTDLFRVVAGGAVLACKETLSFPLSVKGAWSSVISSAAK
jgi:hypothetical protein